MTIITMEFKCSECDKCYTIKMSLSNHKRLIHGNPKLFPCTQCEYTPRIKRDCEMHRRLIHEKIKELSDIYVGEFFLILIDIEK